MIFLGAAVFWGDIKRAGRRDYGYEYFQIFSRRARLSSRQNLAYTTVKAINHPNRHKSPVLSRSILVPK